MRWVKRIILALAVLFVVFLAGAYLLPSQVSLSRSVIVTASAEKVFPHINDLKKFQAWSPWAKLDPKMKVSFSGAENGVGQISTWSGDEKSVGTGSQTIVESVANKKVATALDFGEMGKAKSAWILSDESGSTKIEWTFETELGNNPFMRWMGLMFDRWVGNDYDKGLKALKAIVEK